MAAMWAAAIGAVGSIAGGLLGNKGKKKAAKLQKKALKYQIFSDQQARNDLAPYRESGYQALNAYNRAMGLGRVGVPSNQQLTPQQIYSGQYGSMGANQYAPSKLSPEMRANLESMGYVVHEDTTVEVPVEEDRYGGFYASPGYQFRYDEGIKAIDKSAAARGRLRSGAQNKAITRYGQGIASEEFGAYTNRLAQLAGLGGNATVQGANIGTQGAGNIGNAFGNIGATRQSGYDQWGAVAENIGGMFGNALARRKSTNTNSAYGPYADGYRR